MNMRMGRGEKLNWMKRSSRGGTKGEIWIGVKAVDKDRIPTSGY